MKQSLSNKKINNEIILLIKLYREGNRTARDKILKLIHNFAWKMSFKFTNDKDLQRDLVQEAELSVLMDAIPRFNLASGVPFLSYAVFWIVHAMEIYIKKNLFICELPSHIENYLKAQKIDPTTIDTRGRSLFNYIINDLRINQKYITEKGKEVNLFDNIPDNTVREKDLLNLDDYLSMIEYSSQRNKNIMEDYFTDTVSLKNLSIRYGLSGERIRQIIRKSKNKLKSKLEECI